VKRGLTLRHKRLVWAWAAAGLLAAAGLALVALSLTGRTGSKAATPQAPRPPLAYVATVTPEVTAQPSPTPTPVKVNETPPTRMRIPSIGVDAPVIVLGMDRNGVPLVPDWTNAKRPGWVVAWYDFSALPGQGSNAVFAGHVTWDKAPAVFWSLSQLAPGDTISVLTQEGKELIYRVVDNFTVDPNDPEAVKVMGPTKEDTITIITCGGTFIPNSNDPYGGEYTDRVVVRATLLSVQAASSASQ